MQDPDLEINPVSRVDSVAAILCLQFMVHVMQFYYYPCYHLSAGCLLLYA